MTVEILEEEIRVWDEMSEDDRWLIGRALYPMFSDQSGRAAYPVSAAARTRLARYRARA